MFKNSKITNYEFEIQIKILLLGDSGVGKSSLLSRYTDNRFSPHLMGIRNIISKELGVLTSETKLYS